MNSALFIWLQVAQQWLVFNFYLVKLIVIIVYFCSILLTRNLCSVFYIQSSIWRGLSFKLTCYSLQLVLVKLTFFKLLQGALKFIFFCVSFFAEFEVLFPWILQCLLVFLNLRPIWTRLVKKIGICATEMLLIYF